MKGTVFGLEIKPQHQISFMVMIVKVFDSFDISTFLGK